MMLAYGGGSVKQNGIYDEICTYLKEAGKEIGLPSFFTEMGLTDKNVLQKVADTCNLTAGCCKKFTREEILQILEECW